MQSDAKRKGLKVFLAIAFGGSWAVQIGLAVLFQNKALVPPELRQLVLGAAAPVLMWPPAVGALVARKYIEKSSLKEPGFALPSRGWLLAAWGLPIALVFLAMVASLPFNGIDFWVTPIREAFERAGKEPPIPLGSLVLLQVIAGVTVGALVNSLFAFGEEYGWRGYLLPRLMERIGALRGILLHGAIWGIWHAPMIALIGYNYPQHPYLGVLLFTVFCTLFGVVFAWLQLGSKSILAPTLAHGVFNAVGALPLVLLKDVDAAVSGTLFSVVGMVVLGGVIFVLLRVSAFGKELAPVSR